MAANVAASLSLHGRAMRSSDELEMSHRDSGLDFGGYVHDYFRSLAGTSVQTRAALSLVERRAQRSWPRVSCSVHWER